MPYTHHNPTPPFPIPHPKDVFAATVQHPAPPSIPLCRLHTNANANTNTDTDSYIPLDNLCCATRDSMHIYRSREYQEKRLGRVPGKPAKWTGETGVVKMVKWVMGGAFGWVYMRKFRGAGYVQVWDAGRGFEGEDGEEEGE